MYNIICYSKFRPYLHGGLLHLSDFSDGKEFYDLVASGKDNRDNRMLLLPEKQALQWPGNGWDAVDIPTKKEQLTIRFKIHKAY